MAEIVGLLKALADETRLNMLRLLVSHDYCVGALARRLGISESAASQHLKVLRHVGLVKGEKRGYFTHYGVDRDVLRDAAEAINQLSNVTRVDDMCQPHSGKQHPCCRKEGNTHV